MQRGSVLKDVYDHKSEKLAMEVDELFQGAVETLKAVAPNFKVITASSRVTSTYFHGPKVVRQGACAEIQSSHLIFRKAFEEAAIQHCLFC